MHWPVAATAIDLKTIAKYDPVTGKVNYGPAGSKQTIPACNINGKYTTQTNGANHTPATSQYHIPCLTSSLSSSHESARKAYIVYFVTRKARAGGDEEEVEGEAMVRGMPRETARRAAREKLSMEVMEMRVLEMQRRRDLRRVESGELVVLLGGVCSRAVRGRVPVRRIRGSVAT